MNSIHCPVHAALIHRYPNNGGVWCDKVQTHTWFLGELQVQCHELHPLLSTALIYTEEIQMVV